MAKRKNLRMGAASGPDPRRTGGRFAVLAITVCCMMSAKAGAQGITPGLDGLRLGLAAYTDLYHLCFYHPGLEAGQMSSRDDRGRNIDLGNFHGTHQGAPVLARIKGPAVVYRIWSAGPSGDILFYADGADPVKCGFQEFMDGGCASDPAFAAGRFANYTPLPFRDELVITARNYKLEGAYWQVSYLSLDHDPGPLDDADLDAARRFWTSMGREPGRDPGGTVKQAAGTLVLEPGAARELSLSGAGIITELRIADAADPLAALEDVELKIYWDGSAEAAVDSPVDAFFGNRFDARRESRTTAGSGNASYETLTASATAQGYSSRWPMPFARGMKLALTNRGQAARTIMAESDYREFAALPGNAMRFHARYQEADYPDDALTRKKVYGLSYVVDPDTNYVALDEAGRGWYVGCFLYVRNLGSDWWGEGDEMIWVDGQAEPAPAPTVAGTGTEDEFNWSFSLKENRSPASGCLRTTRRRKEDGQERVGYNALYRYRIGDFVPFTERIKVTYERLGTTTDLLPRFPGSPVNVSTDRGDDYRSVAFWYELP